MTYCVLMSWRQVVVEVVLMSTCMLHVKNSVCHDTDIM
jgi:hypothetical protein